MVKTKFYGKKSDRWKLAIRDEAGDLNLKISISYANFAENFIITLSRLYLPKHFIFISRNTKDFLAGADTGFKWGGGARFFRNKKIHN